MPALKAIFTGDSNPLRREFMAISTVARSSFGGIKSMLLGGLGIYGVESAIRATVSAAEQLINTSKRLSIAPEQLQVLSQAAK